MDTYVDTMLSGKNGENLFLQDLFYIKLKEAPDAIAVTFGSRETTYKELDVESENLSQFILSRSSKLPIIGITTTRSIEMIVGVLAILKSGKAYLPLDPSYPRDRLQQIVSDSKVDLCLSIDSEIPFFESLGIKAFPLNKAYKTENKVATVNSGLGYVLYTSGSTGKPKGVCMGQSPLVNLMLWQHKHSIARKGTRTLQFAPLSFDVSFQEIFATLTTGGTLVLIEDDLRLDPQSLLHFIEEESINRIFIPFVALQYLTEAADATRFFPSCLKEVITAGEQLKITAQLVSFFSALPDCVLYNQYGPTECHVVTELKLEGKATEWPALPSIGKAIDNTDIIILDEKGIMLPGGETGELC
ncbi:MAG TPA: AMP-binding protein, partial [Puia sp.]|nr:AMP-binding protein [Puia sp.]